MSHHEYLVHTYIADRQREARTRLVGRTRDGSRQVVRRATRATLPLWAVT